VTGKNELNVKIGALPHRFRERTFIKRNSVCIVSIYREELRRQQWIRQYDVYRVYISSTE